MDFWQWTLTWLWLIFEIFVWTATIMILAMVIIDLFKDHTLAGGWKAVWLIGLLLFPLVGALVYIIARGRGMTERWSRRRAVVPEDDGWKPAASSSPADDIATAQSLLDAGAISQGEFDALKSKALGKQFFG